MRFTDDAAPRREVPGKRLILSHAAHAKTPLFPLLSRNIAQRLLFISKACSHPFYFKCADGTAGYLEDLMAYLDAPLLKGDNVSNSYSPIAAEDIDY